METALQKSWIRPWIELRSRLVKIGKVMGGKTYLITTSRRVLNTLREFVARERLTAIYSLFIMLRSYIELRRTIE